MEQPPTYELSRLERLPTEILWHIGMHLVPELAPISDKVAVAERDWKDSHGHLCNFVLTSRSIYHDVGDLRYNRAGLWSANMAARLLLRLVAKPDLGRKITEISISNESNLGNAPFGFGSQALDACRHAYRILVAVGRLDNAARQPIKAFSDATRISDIPVDGETFVTTNGAVALFGMNPADAIRNAILCLTPNVGKIRVRSVKVSAAGLGVVLPVLCESRDRQLAAPVAVPGLGVLAKLPGAHLHDLRIEGMSGTIPEGLDSLRSVQLAKRPGPCRHGAPLPGISFARLRAVSTGSWTAQELAAFCQVCPNLEALDLGSLGGDKSIPSEKDLWLGNILARLGGTLRDLTVYQGFDVRAVDLTALRRLKRLHIDTEALFGGRSRRDDISSIPHATALLPPALEHLVLRANDFYMSHVWRRGGWQRSAYALPGLDGEWFVDKNCLALLKGFVEGVLKACVAAKAAGAPFPLKTFHLELLRPTKLHTTFTLPPKRKTVNLGAEMDELLGGLRLDDIRAQFSEGDINFTVACHER